VAAALAVLPSSALAQSHAGHDTQEAGSAATEAYRAANARMHRAMEIPYSGDADVDFVRGMIPHHQGAIDMASVVLEHGRDETTKGWAREIIATQEREIAAMRDYLKARGFG
jgi:uncharacterized protein (DUF305 family)